MIIKAQLSLSTTEARQRFFVYNEDRSVMFEEPATGSHVAIMTGQPKKYFHAEIVNHKVVIGSEALWQDW